MEGKIVFIVTFLLQPIPSYTQDIVSQKTKTLASKEFLEIQHNKKKNTTSIKRHSPDDKIIYILSLNANPSRFADPYMVVKCLRKDSALPQIESSIQNKKLLTCKKTIELLGHLKQFAQDYNLDYLGKKMTEIEENKKRERYDGLFN